MTSDQNVYDFEIGLEPMSIVENSLPFYV